VPPLPTGRALVRLKVVRVALTPVILPPVILTLLAFCPAMVPKPETEVEAMEILTPVTPVTRPWASVVNCGVWVAEP